ncbi:MAG: alpha-L-fucosidase [Candidatus Hydrogenedentes bacterium]|nr:alpha-L-fucosidase [Candidatus Hydrogenedentota bacterium]
MPLFQLLLVVMSTAMTGVVEAPQPYGVVPNESQLQWHELEFYGFIHFTINTFTNKEWGYGDESPSLFNPSDFDADQIVGVAQDAGMTGLILTCKHHDGFCLWPSKYTDHSVAASPWREGKGDMVREFSEACRKKGLRFGVYLSPWDRNHADYGRDAYVTYYRNQLRELLTEYGPIFEVWFDGANGGDGWYGGAKEKRTIDRSSYYNWPETWQIVREPQPTAQLFSDVGPDIRWVGNESGYAGDPCWATYTPEGYKGLPPSPGQTNSKAGEEGTRNGDYWMPAEVDVSIRPGWFYHRWEDRKVRSLDNRQQIYFQSVGRGASLLLNLPPDRRGRIHEKDTDVLHAFGKWYRALYASNLIDGADISASNVRGNDARFEAAAVGDPDRNRYWSTDDDVTTATLHLSWRDAITFNVVSLREYLPLGLRVDHWVLEYQDGGAWREFAQGVGIGNRRLWRGSAITTTAIRLRIEDASACPAISEISLHRDNFE